jgi:cobalamin biosynthesis protein CobD/CbiB
MNKLSFVILQSDAGTLVGTLVATLLVILIMLGVFLIIRSLVLWYWKVDVIVRNQENQSALLTQMFEQTNRRNARANYYKALALDDKEQAYQHLLYIVFYDLTDPDLKQDVRKAKYESSKTRYADAFTRLGYPFPDYPFL